MYFNNNNDERCFYLYFVRFIILIIKNETETSGRQKLNYYIYNLYVHLFTQTHQIVYEYECNVCLEMEHYAVSGCAENFNQSYYIYDII